MTRTLVARLDNAGDVLLAGPAVRAVARTRGPVTMLVGRGGAAAAALLPGVEECIVFDAPWVSFDAPRADSTAVAQLLDAVRSRHIEEAIVLTSFHQSPLPLALLLRLAGVERISATCEDYPGTLLDVRHPYIEGIHEVQQSLSLCAAAGFDTPTDDRLAIDLPGPCEPIGAAPYVVVHPGASVPSRGLPLPATVAAVRELAEDGWDVVVTGGPSERSLAETIAADAARTTVVAGETDLAGLARIIASASAVVCGNTGPAHVAAAVGTPVVQAFAPVVDPRRWHPWRVPHILLGRLDIGCAGCRARTCPIAGQPCLEPFTAGAVVDAVARLTSESRTAAAGAQW